MPEHLRMSCGCKHARKISDDLKWGKHVTGSHDDHLGVQKISAIHHARDDDLRHAMRDKPKVPDTKRITMQKEIKKFNSG